MNVYLNPIAQSAFNSLDVATCDIDDIRSAVTEASRGYKIADLDCIIDMVIEMVEAAFDEQQED